MPVEEFEQRHDDAARSPKGLSQLADGGWSVLGDEIRDNRFHARKRVFRQHDVGHLNYLAVFDQELECLTAGRIRRDLFASRRIEWFFRNETTNLFGHLSKILREDSAIPRPFDQVAGLGVAIAAKIDNQRIEN